jgi:hypothetical protein
MLDGILVRLRIHTTVCDCANDFDRVKQAKRSGRDSVAIRNDKPIASEMSIELGIDAPKASGAFRAAHDFSINNSTMNDVQGNYVRDHFLTCVCHHH